jgi:hypothetical protein
MFIWFGRRFPWVTVVCGAVILVIGLVTGSIGAAFIGCVGLVVGGYRMFASWRRGNGLLGPGHSGHNGQTSQGDGAGTGGMLR